MLEIGSDGELTFVRGDDIAFELELYDETNVTPINLTGCSVRSQIRAKPNGYLMLEFDVEIIDPPNGKIRFTTGHDETRLLRLTEAFWDVELTDSGGHVDTILEPAGVVIVKDITLPETP